MNSVLSCSPRYSKSNVAIVYWTDFALPDAKQFEAQIGDSLGLAQLAKSGYMGQWKIFALGALCESDLSMKAHGRLSQSVTWLSASLRPDPILTYQSFDNFIGSKCYPLFAQQADKLCSSQALRLGVDAVANTFNMMIELANKMFEEYAELSTSQAKRQAAWPPKEATFLISKTPFNTFPSLDWNADATLVSVKSSVLSFKLPVFKLETDVFEDDLPRTILVAFKKYLALFGTGIAQTWTPSLLTELTRALSSDGDFYLIANIFRTLTSIQLAALNESMNPRMAVIAHDVDTIFGSFEKAAYQSVTRYHALLDSGREKKRRAREYRSNQSKRHRSVAQPLEQTRLESPMKMQLDDYVRSIQAEIQSTREFGSWLQEQAQPEP